MKNLMAALTFTLLSFNANAQTYDLVRTITNTPGSIQDSTISFFTQTGTMEINGSTVTRRFHICIIGKSCDDTTYIDEIIGASDKNALLAGDSGDFVPITILSINPLILFYYSGNTFSIDEYVLRK